MSNYGKPLDDSRLYLQYFNDSQRMHCPKCGRDMAWGDFFYNQEECWDCYAEHMVILVNKLYNEGCMFDAERIIFAINKLAGLYRETFCKED